MTGGKGLSREWIEKVVRQNTPVLYMHHKDNFMPCSAEWFMERSELWLGRSHARQGERGLERRILEIGEATALQLLKAQEAHGSERLELRLHPEAKTGYPKAEIDGVPLYANVKIVTNGDVATGRPNAVEINYITFYAHNGWYDVGGCGLWKVGAHDGDWEHFTVRLSMDGSLQGVWFNAHRPRDGCWVAASDLQWTSEGRFKVFVARHGHGTYPRAGRWMRGFLFANDATSDLGAVWRPRTCIVVPEVEKESDRNSFRRALDKVEKSVEEARTLGVMLTPCRGCLLPSVKNIGHQGAADDVEVKFELCPWLQYKGKWGTIISPSAQSWFWIAETPVSRHAFHRAFMQWWPETDKVKSLS